MNKLSRVAVFAIIVVLITLLSAVAVSAAGSVAFSIGSTEVYKGDTTVTVPVNVISNSGIISVRAEIAYDRALTLVGVENGDIIETSWCSNDPEDLASNPYPIYLSDSTKLENITKTGVLVYLTFAVDPEATAGTRYTISINDAICYDADVEKVSVSSLAGRVTVQQKDFTVTFKDWDGSFISEVTVPVGGSATAPDDPVRSADDGIGYIFTGWDTSFDNVTKDMTVTATYDSFFYGDVDGNRVVVPGDSVLLSRYSAGWQGYDESSINVYAADVDEDGRVTPTDGVILSRFLAGWTGYESIPVRK